MFCAGDGSMIFDTDVFIWIQRGSRNAAAIFDRHPDRFIAVQTYMELLQGAQNRVQQAATRRFLKDFGVRILPLSPEIGNRAMSLVEQYALSHNMRFHTICAPLMRSLRPLRLRPLNHFVLQT